MKFIVNLSFVMTKKLLKEGKVFDVCILPAEETLKEIISGFMFENTGFETKPVIAMSRVFGKDTLDEAWDDLNSFISMCENDYLLEFNMPNDACATMSYQDFLVFSSVKGLLTEEVISKLKLSEHIEEENEVVFCPFIDLKYLTQFARVTKTWSKDVKDVKDARELLKMSEFFK